MNNKTIIFIEKAIKIHNNRYNYSNVKYSKSDNKIEIICKVHGLFLQTPHGHLRGFNC